MSATRCSAATAGFCRGPTLDAGGRRPHPRGDRRARGHVSVDILNYRKDGSSFWNALYISPVSNEKGELQFYFASQLDVTDRKRSEHRLEFEKERFEAAVQERTRELQAALEAQETLLHEVDHRVKNNLQMISSLIVMQSRTITDETGQALAARHARAHRGALARSTGASTSRRTSAASTSRISSAISSATFWPRRAGRNSIPTSISTRSSSRPTRRRRSP